MSDAAKGADGTNPFSDSGDHVLFRASGYIQSSYTLHYSMQKSTLLSMALHTLFDVHQCQWHA